jgi:hypothetical protein
MISADSGLVYSRELYCFVGLLLNLYQVQGMFIDRRDSSCIEPNNWEQANILAIDDLEW